MDIDLIIKLSVIALIFVGCFIGVFWGALRYLLFIVLFSLNAIYLLFLLAANTTTSGDLIIPILILCGLVFWAYKYPPNE